MQPAQFISGLLVYVTLMYFLMENIKERERERKSGRNFEKSLFLEDERIDREFLYILIQFKRILIVNDNNNERQKIRGFSEFT